MLSNIHEKQESAPGILKSGFFFSELGWLFQVARIPFKFKGGGLDKFMGVWFSFGGTDSKFEEAWFSFGGTESVFLGGLGPQAPLATSLASSHKK